MKNFLKTVLILLSIFSIFGLVIIGAIYLKRNLKLVKSLFANIEDKVGDLTLEVSDPFNYVQKATKLETEQTADEGVVTFKSPKTSKPAKKFKTTKVIQKKQSAGKLNQRQNEVLNFIKINPNSKMSSVSSVFNKVTPRTLRRDLDKLESMGLLKQEGKTRDTVYKIV